jgi:hypothetical protein
LEKSGSDPVQKSTSVFEAKYVAFGKTGFPSPSSSPPKWSPWAWVRTTPVTCAGSTPAAERRPRIFPREGPKRPPAPESTRINSPPIFSSRVFTSRLSRSVGRKADRSIPSNSSFDASGAQVGWIGWKLKPPSLITIASTSPIVNR